MTQPAACPSCNAPLPEGGGPCATCGARSAPARLKNTQAMSIISLDAPPADALEQSSSKAASDGGADSSADTSGARRAAAHPSQTDVTLVNLSDAAKGAVEAARKIEQERAAAEAAAAEAAAQAQLAAAEAAAARVAARREQSAQAWPRVARSVMVAGGLVLLALFVLDSPLLGALGGVQLVLSVYYLVGGIVLATGAMLPLPSRMRAAFATIVGAVPLFVAGPLVGGVGGWRGLAAAVVILVLPGALLLRARITGSRAARLLVGAAVLLAVLIYVVPVDGVVPLRAALDLLRTGTVAGAMTGVFFLLPLGLAALTLTAFAGEGSTGYGNLWAALVLLNASGATIIAGQLRDELSLVHLGVGLLAAGAAAAVGVADLLDLDPQAG